MTAFSWLVAGFAGTIVMVGIAVLLYWIGEDNYDDDDYYQ